MNFLGTLYGASMYELEIPVDQVYAINPDDAWAVQFAPGATVIKDNRVPHGRMLAGTRRQVEMALRYYANPPQ